MPRSKSVVSFLALLAVGLAAFPTVIASTKMESGVYVTEGWIDSQALRSGNWNAIYDFPNYRSWALKGLDGSDPASSKYIGVFSGIEYSRKDTMTLGFDINLPWPLGSKGHTTDFEVKRLKAEGGDAIVFSLIQPNLATRSVKLEIFPDEKSAKGQMRFRISIRFAWLLNPFFSLAGYKGNVEWRLIKVVSNFEEYCGRPSLARTPR
jgi:hypothetical protein